jgi:hypothetical protein
MVIWRTESPRVGANDHAEERNSLNPRGFGEQNVVHSLQAGHCVKHFNSKSVLDLFIYIKIIILELEDII